MKVTIRLVQGARKTQRIKGVGPTAQTLYLDDVVYHGVSAVLYESDWVRLIPLVSPVKQISYRKETIFTVIEEKE